MSYDTFACSAMLQVQCEASWLKAEIAIAEHWVHYVKLFMNEAELAHVCTWAIHNLKHLELRYSEVYEPICGPLRSEAGVSKLQSQLELSQKKVFDLETKLESESLKANAMKCPDGAGHAGRSEDPEEDVKAAEMSTVQRLCPTPARRTSRMALLQRQRSLTRRCCALKQREQEASQEKESMATAYAATLVDIEVAAKKLVADTQMPRPEEPEEPAGVIVELATLQAFRSRMALVAKTLSTFVERSQQAKEVLDRVLCCTISCETFRRPVLAPDGQVYEEWHILEWLRRSPISPMDKQPMRPKQLMRDRVVEQTTEALWLLRGQEAPSETYEVFQADATKDQTEQVAPVRLSLLDAINARDEVSALTFLQGPDRVAGLNAVIGEENASLLHLAVLNELPAVALAIAKHPRFREHDFPMGSAGLTPIHLAACLGDHALCEALLQRCGRCITVTPVGHSVTLYLNPSGLELKLMESKNPLELARLYGHSEIVALMNTSSDAVLNEADG